ncbi:amino acid adenylation domain-containing protein [Streptomyces sp. NPDC056045]|uniref:non-ribosomal peptide synthetase n=1 Tax=Streptomyces sp. NPDC056045 TaxID=3345691 RepID=UPI0035D99A9C
MTSQQLEQRAAEMPHASHPMSFEQESIWLNDQFQNGRSRYVESWAHRIGGRLDVPAVEAALSEIVRRHEALRTRLHLAGERPVQTVLPAGPVTVTRRSVPADQLTEALREALAAPLPLDAPPLLRAYLFEQARGVDGDAVLLVALHHAAMDGTSLHLLDAEFSACYRAALAGTGHGLPELPQQIGGYAERRRRSARLTDAAHLAYWRTALRDAPDETAFPTDRPRAAVMSHRGGQVEFTLDATVTRGIGALAEHRRSSPYVVLLAALTALTHRLSGQLDLVIGTPVSLRDEPAVDSMIACLAEVLPVRQKVVPAMSFAALVSATQDVVLDTVEHREVSFSRLVGELGVERTLSRFPLFQIVFTADSREAAGLNLPGASTERLALHNGTAKYDVFLSVVPEGDGLRGFLEYSTDLFDRRTAELLAERYRMVVADAVARPETALADLRILSDAEERLIRGCWTSGPDRPGQDAPMLLAHTVFADRARRTPDAPAVVRGEDTLSYRDLDASADAVAALLVERGHAGRRVAVCVERTFDLPVAVLAVLKAAGACVPLDAGYPAERIAYMLRDSGATALVTRRSVAAGLTLPDDLPVIFLDDVPPHRTAAGEEAKAPSRLPAAGDDDIAYVLYTSGSTGRPKGVAMPHRSLAGLVDWQHRRSDSRPGARTLQFAPLSFDVAFQELFATWASGGAVVLIDDAVRTDPERLCDVLSEHRVERLFLPYVALQQLARYACAARRRCPSLREVVTAGEQLFVTPAIRRFFTDLTHASLENQYGPTETHVVTAERLAGPPASWPERPSIGRPVPGARVYVLDGALRPCPVGTTGELHIGGRAPAQGYLGLPELTAERFLRDPHAPAPGRVYRTGDLARLLPDGRIELLGRTDDQVKIRGHRVETGEVESAVKAVPGVADAVVVTTDGAPGDGKRLVAGYLPAAEDGITPEALRSALLDRLPSFMVPTTCVPLTSFPLTPSGKVDRAALALDRAGTQATHPPGEPARTPTEKRVTELCAEVLGVGALGALGALGVEDDFFARGGDSLRAVRLALALREEFGVAVPMNCVFTAPTPAALARLVDRLGQRPDAPDPTADLVLPPDIVPAPQVLTVVTNPKEVLLTGATGFLGAFLLRELLIRTSARVHCLVRGTDQAHAAARLRAVQEAYGIVNEEAQGRIVVHAGDLALPRLGLSEEVFDRLARTVDVVHHAGASVNLAQAYAQSRPANVCGTVEVLRLAAAHRTVPVHHISTVGVFAGPALTARRLRPDEPLTPVEALVHGYTQSKWVAERLVETARERGLPVSVYRPTRIAGDSTTGACQSADFLWLLLKGCAQAGLAPRLDDVAFDLVPVDHVSRAVVALASNPEAAGRNFHLAGERLMPFGRAVACVRRELGLSITDVPVREWLRAIETLPDNAAFPLLGVMGDGRDDDPEGSVRFDAADTRRLLQGTGITCPDIDAKVFMGYVRYFADSGFLPTSIDEGSR